MVSVLRLAAPFLLTLGLAAQRTWTVDANNGPGTDFTDTPPAVAAASHGDTIVVRKNGNYSGFSTSKGISILCEPGAWFALSPYLPVVIDGVPAGRQFALEGVAFGFVSINVRNCQGRVLLDRIKHSVYPLVVEDCTQVQIHGSQLGGENGGIPALRAVRSTVAISGSSLRGQTGFHLADSFSAAECTDSTVVFSGGTMTGGGAENLQGGKPALVATRSTVDLRGDATTILRAGFDRVTWRPVPGILTDGGTILMDPNVSVLPSNGGPPIGGTAAVTVQRLPALLSPGAPLGGVVRGDLFAQQGAVALFFVGLAADALAAPPHGTVWWDINGPWALTGIGVIDATEHLRHDLPVPMDRAFVGPVFVRQALTVPVSGPWLLSNPAAYVVH